MLHLHRHDARIGSLLFGHAADASWSHGGFEHPGAALLAIPQDRTTRPTSLSILADLLGVPLWCVVGARPPSWRSEHFRRVVRDRSLWIHDREDAEFVAVPCNETTLPSLAEDRIPGVAQWILSAEAPEPQDATPLVSLRLERVDAIRAGRALRDDWSREAMAALDAAIRERHGPVVPVFLEDHERSVRAALVCLGQPLAAQVRAVTAGATRSAELGNVDVWPEW